MLKVEHLKFWYRRGIEILKDVSLEVGKGEIVCLFGPNGTGKTTLMRCILGLNRAKGGHILLDGTDVTDFSPKKRAQIMGYVPQSSSLSFPYTVGEVALMGRLSHLGAGAKYGKEDRQIALDCLEMLHISHLASRPFQELSGGEKQMVLVARALAQQASVLIMDEPTASLDYSNQVKILKIIRRLAAQGYTVLMTSHFPDQAFLACTTAVLMNHGIVQAYGTPESTVTSDSLAQLYQTDVCVTQADAAGQRVRVCIPLM